MKKLVSILLILVLVFSLSCVAFADNDSVISPEHDNTDPDKDNPAPGPQTGDTGAIYWVIAAAVLALGTAVFCGRKLIVNK